MEAALRDRAAGLLAEAMRTGEPVPPLTYEETPRSVLDGQRIAARMLDLLGLAPIGLRLALAQGGRTVPGPLLERSMLEDEATIPLAPLHHPMASAAILGILAEDLPRRGDEMPVFASLHPALDISDWRLRDLPTTTALAAADLAGLGLVVSGKGKRMEPMRLRVALAAEGTWRRGVEVDIEESILAAGLAARRAGGLPAGAFLVAQLGPTMVPTPGLELTGSFGRLGRVRARFQ
jgi:2-keto-4-pentenoate hydratase